MVDINNFNSVFPLGRNSSSLPRNLDAIKLYRRKLGGKLFFDLLLARKHIGNAVSLYPPRNYEGLQEIHYTIVSSNCFDHEKQSMLYYLLLVMMEQSAAADFARNVHLPDSYATLMTGLWHMDSMRFQAALEYLTQPSLTPLFGEEILCALARNAPDNDPTLPLAYYHTVSPALESPAAVEALHAAMCRASVAEAFFFARRQPEAKQKAMLEQLIHITLSAPPGADCTERSMELVNLPFNAREEAWFEAYLDAGNGRSLQSARGTLAMRKIGMARYAEVVSQGKGPAGRKINELNWDVLRQGLADGMGSQNAEQLHGRE